MLQNFVYVRYAPGFEGTPVTNSVLLRIECNLGSGSVSTAGLDFVVTRVNQVEYVKTTASTEVYKHANINKEVRDMLSYGANKTVATVVNEAVVAGNNHTSEYGVVNTNSVPGVLHRLMLASYGTINRARRKDATAHRGPKRTAISAWHAQPKRSAPSRPHASIPSGFRSTTTRHVRGLGYGRIG